MAEEQDADSQAPAATGEVPSQTGEGTPQAAEKPTEAAPDLQAQVVAIRAELEAEKKAKQTFEEKLRSTQANLNQRFDLQAELVAIRRGEARRDAMLQLLLEAQQDGGEELPKRLAALRQQQQEEDALDTTQREAMNLRADVEKEGQITGLDIKTAPEFQEARETWQEGVDKKDIRLLHKAVRQAREVGREAQAKALEKIRQEAKETGRKEGEAELRRKLGKSGEFDTATARQASAPGGISDADFLTKYVAEPGKHNSPADHKRAEKILAGI